MELKVLNVIISKSSKCIQPKDGTWKNSMKNIRQAWIKNKRAEVLSPKEHIQLMEPNSAFCTQ